MTPASDEVRREWARRVVAEYRSAAATQHLTLWLLQIAASPDLVREGLAIADDELTHAELSHAVLVAAGGALTGPIPREDLGLTRAADTLEDDVLLAAVEIFCLGETLAVRLFGALREHCDVPVARQALDRVLRDEVRHRDFGWTLLDWLLTGADEASRRATVHAALPGMAKRLRAHYASPSLQDAETCPDRAWGLMAPARYAALLEDTVTRDYLPRFAARDIDGSCLCAA